MGGCLAFQVLQGIVRAGVYKQFYHIRMTLGAGAVESRCPGLRRFVLG